MAITTDLNELKLRDWLTRAVLLVMTASPLAIAPSTSWAVSRIWTGAFNSDWYNGANWSPVGGPFEDDQLSVFSGTIAGSQSPVVRDGGSILLSGSNTSASFPAYWFLDIGEIGVGTVTVRNGADLTSYNVTMVGDEEGSDGKLYVEGGGSSLTTDRLWVGVDGLGRMEITGGGWVTSDEGVIALNPTAAGSRVVVSGAGSTWDLGTSWLVPEAGLGYLDIEAGGAVLSGQGQIGVNGGRGEVTVTGASSRWEMMGSLDVGLYGAGTLAIASGGRVSATDLGTHALTYLGHTPSIITVDGTDSRLEIDATMNIGKGFDISNTGPASLTVGNGGVVETGGTLTIFSSGTVNVQAGGSLYADVLDRTVGTLNTSSGSQLYANQLVGFSGYTIIGGSLTLGHSGGLGNFSVGAGELLFVNRGLVVGLDDGSEAHVTASSGGKIDTAIASIAAFPGSVGEVVVDTGSSWLNVDTIQVGLFGDGTLEASGGTVQTPRLVLGQEGGMGTVNLSGASGLVSISDKVSVGDASDFNVMGGKLQAKAVAVSAGGAFNFTGGSLDVETFDGVLVQDGGRLLIGGSPGTMTVTENYTFNAGMLEIELGGVTQGAQYDFLDVTGDVNLAGGSLDVSVLGPFTLAAGQVFDVLNVSGTLSGEFAGLGQGALVGNFGGTDLFITYHAGDGNDVALVTTAPIFAGDYNGDGIVNAADYTTWRNNLGAPAGTLPNDADGGVIGPAQYATWKNNFGNTLIGSGASSIAAVPEPGATPLLIATLILVPLAGRRFG